MEIATRLKMSFDPDDVYRLMLCMYKNGVLERVSRMQGEVLEEIMADAGLSMGDLLNRMDETTEKVVRKLDRLLGFSGPVFRLLANDTLMKGVARLLDVRFVRERMTRTMKKKMYPLLTGDLSA